MQQQISHKVWQDTIFTGVVGTDLLESTGGTLKIRLNNPVAWTIGSGFLKIDMPHGKIDDRCARRHTDMHGASIIRQQNSALRQQSGKLTHGRTTCHILDRVLPASLFIHLRYFGNSRFLFGTPNEGDPPVPLSAEARERESKKARMPRLHTVTRPGLNGNPIGSPLESLPRPRSRLFGNRKLQRTKRTRSAPTQGVDIDKIKSIEPTELMEVGEVRHPWIVHNHAAIPSTSSSTSVRSSDIAR
jgi:hypothetical protein